MQYKKKKEQRNEKGISRRNGNKTNIKKARKKQKREKRKEKQMRNRSNLNERGNKGGTWEVRRGGKK